MAYGENLFTAAIDQNGVIWDVATGRNRQSVGIDIQREQEYIKQINEMQETIDNYYSKLVEIGIIQPPKTPEQIAQETANEQIRLAHEQAAQQAQINQALLSAIDSLRIEMGALRDGNHRHSVEPSVQPIGSDSEDSRKAIIGSKKSN